LARKERERRYISEYMPIIYWEKDISVKLGKLRLGCFIRIDTYSLPGGYICFRLNWWN